MTEILHRADLKTLWLLGRPVGHSLSPLIQNTALSHLGLGIVYLAAPVEAEGFESAVRGLLALGALGANVTVPYKEEAFRLCDSVSERANAMGACNVLSFVDGKIHGDNTDGSGWLRGLEEELGCDFPKRALVLGAGGAARAVVHSLLQRQVCEIVIFNRTQERAEQLADELAGGSHRLNTAGYEQLEGHLSEGCLVVQTTSAGLDGVASPFPNLKSWPEGAFLSELIYGRETPFFTVVKTLGGRGQDGLPMLVEQAAESLSIWLGRPLEEIPSKLMLQTARREVAARFLPELER